MIQDKIKKVKQTHLCDDNLARKRKIKVAGEKESVRDELDYYRIGSAGQI